MALKSQEFMMWIGPRLAYFHRVLFNNIFRRTNVKICLMKNFRQLEYRNCDFIEDDLNIGTLIKIYTV